MPQPTEVNPSNFKIDEIIYNVDGFSIAYGKWKDDDEKCLALRWDGEETGLGFPQTFGNPVWLVVPHELTIPFATALLSSSVDANKRPVIRILEKILV